MLKPSNDVFEQIEFAVNVLYMLDQLTIGIFFRKNCLIGCFSPKNILSVIFSLSAPLLPFPTHTPSRNLGKLIQPRRMLSSCDWEFFLCRQKRTEELSLFLEQVYFLEFEAMQDYLLMCLSTSVACNLFSEVPTSYFLCPCSLAYHRVGFSLKCCRVDWPGDIQLW